MENVSNETNNTKCCGKKKNSNNMLAGIILITVGVLFLLEKLIDIRFGDMWPIIIIVVGGCIVFKSIQCKNNKENNQ